MGMVAGDAVAVRFPKCSSVRWTDSTETEREHRGPFQLRHPQNPSISNAKTGRVFVYTEDVGDSNSSPPTRT